MSIHHTLVQHRVLTGKFNRHVLVNGVRYHYLEMAGPKEPVLLIHGLGSSSYTWREIIPYLNDAGHHVYALDMKGFGWSDKPEDGRYDPLSLTQDVAEWMDAVGLGRAVMVGNSLGAAVAGFMGLFHPQKVSRLVLLNALMPYDISIPLLLRLAHLPLAPKLAQYVVTRNVVRKCLLEVFHDPDKVTPEKVEAYYRPLVTSNGLHAQALLARSFDPKKYEKYLKQKSRVKAPSLVIWGENDRWIPLKFGHRLMDDNPNGATFVVFSECGHMPQEEKPLETARCIVDFLGDAKLHRLHRPEFSHVERRLRQCA